MVFHLILIGKRYGKKTKTSKIIMNEIKPLKSERLTVRLDSERLTKLEYWASENPLKAKSYNQIVQTALDEYLDRHTPSATEELITVKVSRQAKARLYHLYEGGYGNIDTIVESKEIRDNLAEHGFEFVRKILDPSEIAREWDELFENYYNKFKRIERETSHLRLLLLRTLYLISSRLHYRKLKKFLFKK